MSPVLLSRTIDPLLGIFTGFFAFYLYETNPRTAPPERERLHNLLKWKMDKRNQELEEKGKNEEQAIDWKGLVSTPEGDKKQ
ncbi:hypothetical protein NLI96_g1589 [Meripilus lineatus]|uniref:Uncharacterized protein n=1 Tax=Meripilus lineatus TaxID=2056292 RepID=A0AAD5YHC6_9APHY|nr:hypothetical protein NLI96_g1589 [Physisporinus lineatus]